MNLDAQPPASWPYGRTTVEITRAGQVVTRTVHARFSNAVEGLILAQAGTKPVKTFDNPEALVRWVRRADKRAADHGTSTVTTIEWDNCPEGFTPPEVTL
jgi:hypothetical protein